MANKDIVVSTNKYWEPFIPYVKTLTNDDIGKEILQVYNRDLSYMGVVMILKEIKNLGRICSKCGNNNANNRCSICKIHYYCSRQCQNADWTKHKLVCKKGLNFPFTARPKYDNVIYIDHDFTDIFLYGWVLIDDIKNIQPDIRYSLNVRDELHKPPNTVNPFLKLNFIIRPGQYDNMLMISLSHIIKKLEEMNVDFNYIEGIIKCYLFGNIDEQTLITQCARFQKITTGWSNMIGYIPQTTNTQVRDNLETSNDRQIIDNQIALLTNGDTIVGHVPRNNNNNPPRITFQTNNIRQNGYINPRIDNGLSSQKGTSYGVYETIGESGYYAPVAHGRNIVFGSSGKPSSERQLGNITDLPNWVLKLTECKDEEGTDNYCVICLTNKKKICAIPCMHMSSCAECALILCNAKDITDMKCPICRETIKEWREIFM